MDLNNRTMYYVAAFHSKNLNVMRSNNTCLFLAARHSVFLVNWDREGI